MKKQINRASELLNIQDSYFVRMMMPQAEKIASPYLGEEEDLLKKLITSIPNSQLKNCVVVGAGFLWYLQLIHQFGKKYYAVEPLAHMYVQKEFSYLLTKHENIKIIPKKFGEFPASEISRGNSLFIFIFNILAYIPSPIKKINEYIKEGDILFVSSWARTNKAIKLRKKYFEYLNSCESDSAKKIDQIDTIGLCDLDFFPFERLKNYKNHKRITNEISDVLIIYC